MPDLSRFLTGHVNSLLYIGKLAEITGASCKAIQLYEAQEPLRPRVSAKTVYAGSIPAVA